MEQELGEKGWGTGNGGIDQANGSEAVYVLKGCLA